jgi:hypothetical protein
MKQDTLCMRSLLDWGCAYGVYIKQEYGDICTIYMQSVNLRCPGICCIRRQFMVILPQDRTRTMSCLWRLTAPDGLYYTTFTNVVLNNDCFDDGNAKGLSFLPTPEMQPMRLPCELRYRLYDPVSCEGCWVCEVGFPNWVVPRI